VEKNEQMSAVASAIPSLRSWKQSCGVQRQTNLNKQKAMCAWKIKIRDEIPHLADCCPQRKPGRPWDDYLKEKLTVQFLSVRPAVALVVPYGF
jgi:hypothetical protein